MSEKEIRADAKLKNLSEEDLELLWSWRYPEDPKEKKTYGEIQVEIPLKWGFTVSSSTLSEFYAWLKQVRRMKAAQQRAEQAKLEYIQQNPDASIEELERLGQMVFMSETVEDGNVKGFVALMKATNAKRKLEIEDRRVKLLEEKAAQAKAAEEVTADDTISDEEKQAKLRSIFGIG